MTEQTQLVGLSVVGTSRDDEPEADGAEAPIAEGEWRPQLPALARIGLARRHGDSFCVGCGTKEWKRLGMNQDKAVVCEPCFLAGGHGFGFVLGGW